MKMKKLATMAMVGAMVIGAGNTVCAAPITTLPGSTNQNVVATYAATEVADTVYSVDVAWGNMAYTYTVGDEGTWNPSTHQFDNAAEGTWSCEKNQDKVTVTNHSNAPVNVNFSYAAEVNYDDIKGTFDKTSQQLATAEGTEVSNAPVVTATLSLDGALDKNVTTSTQIGTATVSLSEVL